MRSSWAPPCLAVVHLRPGHATAGRQLSGCGSRLTCEEGLLGIVVPRTSLSVVAGVEVTRCTWACETVVATVERVLLRACRTVRAFPGAEWWRGVLHACTRTRCRECPASWGAPTHPPSMPSRSGCCGMRGSLFTFYLSHDSSSLGRPDVDHKGAKVFGLPPQASLAKPRPRWRRRARGMRWGKTKVKLLSETTFGTRSSRKVITWCTVLIHRNLAGGPRGHLASTPLNLARLCGTLFLPSMRDSYGGLPTQTANAHLLRALGPALQ